MKNKLIVVVVVAVLLIPGMTFAQTSVGVTAAGGVSASFSSLQAELAALLTKVQTLEAQMALLSSSTVIWNSSSTISSTSSSSISSTGLVQTSTFTSSTWCYAFANNLSLGSSGAAVTALQTALVKDGEAVSSSGSFGAQTEAAVKNFQEKYNSSVLAPYALSAGTGYVGTSTRRQLDLLFPCGIVVPPPILPPHNPSSTASSTATSSPIIIPPPHNGSTTPPVTTTTTPPVAVVTSTITSNPALTPSSGSVATTVTIHGSGFASAGNQVLLNGMVAGSLDGLSSPDGKTLVFTVPSGLGPNCKPEQACPAYELVVTPRAYAVTVVSNSVTQSFGSFTVTPGSSTITVPPPMQPLVSSGASATPTPTTTSVMSQ